MQNGSTSGFFFFHSSRTFAVFILQKEKDTLQTKKITSVTSIPKDFFCFSSGRQESFSPAGEGRQGCEVTGRGCTPSPKAMVLYLG